jgi:AcrR family transcriptional regulator
MVPVPNRIRNKEKLMSHSLLRTTDKTPENLSRRERLSLHQRDEILDTALRLFSEKSYSNVSMQDIAKEAEFGMGTLYRSFSSKEDLYKALIVQMAQNWHHKVLRAVEQERDPVSAIEKCISIHRELFFQNLPFVRLFYNSAHIHVGPVSEPALHDYRDEYLKKLASIFEKGIKAKIFRDGNPYHMALALYGIILTFLFQMNEDPAGFRKGDELSCVRDLFLKGVMRNGEGNQDR